MCVKSLSGQTIEVLNTDAEGRLVLADALTYTQRRFKPKFVIDLATLDRRDRGGAWASSMPASFPTTTSWRSASAEPAATAASAVGGCRSIRAYDKMIRSKIADMKNIGGANSGSITAAQFLQRFIEKARPGRIWISRAWPGRTASRSR